MTKTGSPLKRLLLVLALISILACPALFVTVTFFPSTLAFLDPVLCPQGMHLDNETRSQSDERGNVTSVYAVCVGDGEQVDVTGRLLAILFALPIVGVVLLVVWALTGKEPPP